MRLTLLLERIVCSPRHVQVLTGHGGFAAYLHRFKIKNSPACACDPDIAETVIHNLIDFPRFDSTRYDLECVTGVKIGLDTLPTLMLNVEHRNAFLDFLGDVAKRAGQRNK